MVVVPRMRAVHRRRYFLLVDYTLRRTVSRTRTNSYATGFRGDTTAPQAIPAPYIFRVALSNRQLVKMENIKTVRIVRKADEIEKLLTRVIVDETLPERHCNLLRRLIGIYAEVR